MNRELARKVADAVLYEGYLLYPYRPSALKNRQRWSFGILYPPAYAEVRSETEKCALHSECLLEAAGDSSLHMELRFLHLQTQEVRQPSHQGEPLSSLVDGRLVQSGGEEGVARSIECGLPALPIGRHDFPFRFSGLHGDEPLKEENGNVVGQLIRSQHEISGSISIATEKIRDDVRKLTIDVENTTQLRGDAADRNSALLGSLLSAHLILTVTGGEFASLLDPPEHLREAASGCKNVGNFPVLVGDQPARDMMLCSPILLYDYPQIAPESAGDFYDATEMDEMLTLRVMTLTENEKNEMRTAGDHVRNLLERTEQSARDQLMRTHGTIRGMRTLEKL